MLIKKERDRKLIDESMTVEWKQSVAEINEIIEAVVAFANTEGGRIYIGISPDGKVSGVQIGKGTIEKLVNQIAQHTDSKLYPKVFVKKLEGKNVIVVEVKESRDHLVLAFGRPHKRVGKSSPKMSKDEYERFWNSGELSKEITPEQLKGKHRSLPRNPFLASKLYLIKYIERWGRGTNRIVEEMRAEKLPDPLFSNNSGGFEIVLNGPGKGFAKAIDDIKLHKIDINDRQKKIIEYLKIKDEISRKEYSEISGVSLRQANKDLNDLLIKKIIVQVGMGRNTKYRVHD